MIAALLIAQAGAVDAERAFAADARKLGQWTAFRKWATDDAVMFWPQPVNAQEKLKTLPDPPKAVEWRPARSYVSCDGTMAANTGPWRRPDGSVGYFSTIWAKQPGGGWKWTLDHGDASKKPKFAWEGEPVLRRASCKPQRGTLSTAVSVEGQAFRTGKGAAVDGTLRYDWLAGADGGRTLSVMFWNGRLWERAIEDFVDAPIKP